ncbi:MAG: type I glutamate--ammonia ligase [Treponema sp.]|jgi:glutamine synthetase|nr:type I glutamate--ammonia ligase [Treponema sp.]
MFEDYCQLSDFIKEKNIKIIDFKEIDLAGRWHHLSIPAERFTNELLKTGIGFDGSSYGFLSVEKSDMVFLPDIKSAFVDPVAEIPSICMIGDIYKIGEEAYERDAYMRYEDDPRYIAEKAEKYLAETGISDVCLFGPEFEFYVLDNMEFRVEANNIEVHLDSAQAEWNTINSSYDEFGKNRGYKVLAHKGYHADLPYDVTHDLRNKFVRLLEDNGVPVKYHHHENGGPGQVEIEVCFSTLREMGDRTQKLKYIVKNTAMKNGKTVTFMPKPFFGEAGSGMHVHLQMFKGGKPIFYDKNGYSCLSETALFAIGGILRHSEALMAFTNPSTNSYKRLVPGYEAPVTICFATANRSAVIRIPGYTIQPEEKRFEFRPPDATANPYLCYSAILMAAIDGIINKIDPVKEGFGPYDKNMYHLTEKEKKRVKALPDSLAVAANAMEKDNDFLLAGGVFTKSIIESQLTRIRRDHEEVGIIPHPVEFKRYFDL